MFATNFRKFRKRLFPTAGMAIAFFGSLSVGMDPSLAANMRPVSFGHSWDGEEHSLQNILDGMTVSGPNIDTKQDQTPYDLFTSTAIGNSSSTLMAEVADYASTNQFGIYSAKTGEKAVLFDGNATSSSQSFFSFLENGDLKIWDAVSSNSEVEITTKKGFGNQFGFFLNVAAENATYYSDDSLNPNGSPQAVIYQGNNQTQMQLPNYEAGLFNDNQFIVAFEDLLVENSDRDYNDMVAMVGAVEPIEPVPEPTSMAGLALVAGTWFLTRRRSER
ncbi:DUF4114 domain-containing protein [Geitlerinema sp. PCC 9228]|jgi:hypothetical protein|uniref:DUF4114 domain-containing protein n=1 Tax=Geitlerinema sp. PCC 9228 TaxID=111611 RepID=UPI0008F985F4|nr:DUF4114 domain-containing protein [Geitlerinema sp. PCC 9228]